VEDLRTDEGLMSAYRQGDASAFDALYARHRAGTYRYILHQCWHRDAADAVFQEVWLAVVKARTTYEPTAKFSTWVYRIAHNKIIDWYRSAGRAAEFEVELGYDSEDLAAELSAPQVDNPEAMLERAELANRIVAALETLPAVQRDAFLMVVEGGMTVQEIGQATGAGFETAKSRLRYAYAKLRSLLTDLRPT
jgi:RNA polymerase sigma-70 factor, ECF subfamily